MEDSVSVQNIQMARHRAILSPNPWKHGSAKRVVRALDYANAENCNEQQVKPTTNNSNAENQEKILQQKNKLHLLQITQLQNKEQALKQKEAQLQNKEQMLSQKEIALNQKQQHLDNREKIIQERERKIIQDEKARNNTDQPIKPPQAQIQPVQSYKSESKSPSQHQISEAEPSSAHKSGGDKLAACTQAADWARGEKLASTLQQQVADPEVVFHPLNQQKSCKLSEIFSGDCINRPRAPNSDLWTPSSAEASVTASEYKMNGRGYLQLIGTIGDYSTELVNLPLLLMRNGTAVVGRSSSCDVTFTRDDQISRRHAQVEVREGKAYLRDLGSTYGTKLNGVTITSESQIRPGDTLTLGASSFRLQIG